MWRAMRGHPNASNLGGCLHFAENIRGSLGTNTILGELGRRWEKASCHETSGDGSQRCGVLTAVIRARWKCPEHMIGNGFSHGHRPRELASKSVSWGVEKMILLNGFEGENAFRERLFSEL